jgi:2-ketocyclohexanecarboxyl-CoA hydrolase
MISNRNAPNYRRRGFEEYTDIIYEAADNVCTITINRPKVLNAWTQHTLYELEDAFLKADSDSSVGVIVLTGTGERAFCVGGDVNWEASGGLAKVDFNLGHLLIDLAKPVIARVNGYSIGGGNHLAYFCDITIAAEHAQFGQAGPRVGSPAGGYMVSHLTNIVGHKRAREIWMLCRKYSAHQMLEWGLVNAVVPFNELDNEVRRWADEMLALSPTCLKIVKASFKQAMAPVMKAEMQDLIDEYAPNYFETGEQHEGASAFLEKRKPDFSPWR